MDRASEGDSLTLKQSSRDRKLLKPAVCVWCRNMDEMWDETLTEECRQNFVKSMYKFPKGPTIKLNSGKRLPMLGLGTWKATAVQDTVERALRTGFRCSILSPKP